MSDEQISHADQDEKPAEAAPEVSGDETAILPRDPALDGAPAVHPEQVKADAAKEAEAPAVEPEKEAAPTPTPKEVLAEQNPDFITRHSKRTAS
jgi:hypothetical protein